MTQTNILAPTESVDSAATSKNASREKIFGNPAAISLRDSAAVAQLLPYDRTRLPLGAVHLGVGQFHRSHQCYVAHKVAKQAYIGLELRNRPLAEALHGQNGLYSLRMLSAENSFPKRPEIIGSLLDVVYVGSDAGTAKGVPDPDFARALSLLVGESGKGQKGEIKFEIQIPTHRTFLRGMRGLVHPPYGL